MASDPRLDPPDDSARPPLTQLRTLAVLEVLLCSDFPTQMAIGATFAAFGFGPYTSSGRLSVAYVVGLSLTDTAALVALVFLFLRAHGERPHDVLIGRRPVVPEMLAGLPMVLVALGIAIVVLVGIGKLAPSLHTEHNPLQDLLRSPRDAWLFAFVLVVAGGVREEIQRAFLIHRFDVWLGGGVVGVIVTGAAFGAGHLIQGVDAALATGLMGAFWGIVYLRRRSCLAPMVSHAGFDLLQIAQFFFVAR